MSENSDEYETRGYEEAEHPYETEVSEVLSEYAEDDISSTMETNMENATEEQEEMEEQDDAAESVVEVKQEVDDLPDKDDLQELESRNDIELEELPRDEDLTAEELELQEPLDQWLSDLVPSMREIIAPELFAEEPQTDAEQPPEEEPCPIPEVLLSDSPMMVRFQATLRAHLLRQKQKLEDDIRDMELNCNKTNQEIKEIGLVINKEQEHLNKQRDLTNKYKAGVIEVDNKRKQFDDVRVKKEKEFKEIHTLFKETELEDKALFHQLEEMSQLSSRLAELEKTQDNELKFAKSLSEKQRTERLKMAEEKQKQDLYIWKLSQELEWLTLETQAFIEQTELKKEEISQLTQLITDVEADTEALRKENSLIISATQDLMQEVKKRDRGYKDAEEKVTRVQHELSLVLTRIRGFNKSLKFERDRKVQLESSKNKFEQLTMKCENTNQKLNASCEDYLERLSKIQTMIDEMELMQSKSLSYEKGLKAQLKIITDEMDQLTLSRFNINQNYLKTLSNTKVQSTISKKLEKDMDDLSRESQDVSLRKLEVDCKIGELMTEIERSKVKKVQLEVKIDNLKNNIKDKEATLLNLEVHRKKIRRQIEDYKSKVIGSTKCLDNYAKINDESQGKGQLSRRVDALQTELVELDTKINETKQSWMDVQNGLIENTYKLSHLESATNMTRKHLFLIKYKREKLESKLMQLESEKRKVDKEFSWYHNKLTSITLENYRHEQAKEKLTDIARETEIKFISVLKEAEDMAIRLREEICELEETNKEMSDDIERHQREFLAWEKKWKMAVEAREKLEKERAATGEIGAMKQEIHRMEVRYGQLKKVQEKLSLDLELCISRRDNIMDLALAKEKRTSSSKASYTREQFNKKIDSIKQKIKQLNTALKHSEKEIGELELRRDELMGEYLKKQKQLVEVKQGVDKLETEIQEGQLHKYKSLELVVRRQRKIRLLDEVKHNRYRLFCRNEVNLPHEEEKQELMTCHLIEVVQSLLIDFPKLKLQLLQIFNTLTSPLD